MMRPLSCALSLHGFNLSTLIKTVFNNSRPVFQKTWSSQHTRHELRSFKRKVVKVEQGG